MDTSNLSAAPQDQAALEVLNGKINALLPPRYQHCYSDVSPVSMGSAALVFGADGKVAWNEIWTSFCDLALAGGPPHRGALLEPATAEEVLAEPDQYRQVIDEIGRGLWLVAGLPILLQVTPGWVAVHCQDEEMAAWLVRAVVAENVSARRAKNLLYLPAGPHFRLAKEIKNVVTVLAKTCHYWTGHMSAGQKETAAFETSVTLLEPPLDAQHSATSAEYRALVDEISHGIQQATGLAIVPSQAAGWVGIPCADVDMAVWLLRAVVVDNVLARREEAVLYVPANPAYQAEGKARRIVATVAAAWQLWGVYRAGQCCEDTSSSRPSTA